MMLLLSLLLPLLLLLLLLVLLVGREEQVRLRAPVKLRSHEQERRAQERQRLRGELQP